MESLAILLAIPLLGGLVLWGIGDHDRAPEVNAVFSFATLAAFNYRRARTLLVTTVWLMLAFTLWLLFVQAFRLHAFCRYCLVSAAITFLLAGITVAMPPTRRS